MNPLDCDYIRRSRRILIYGVAGSGKSRLAGQLSAILSLPLVNVDDLLWRPGWRALTTSMQGRVISPILAEDSWLIDGIYTGQLELALERAELIICLNAPKYLTFLRLLGRQLRLVASGREVCNGNTETISHLFSRRSVLAWYWSSYARKRETIQMLAARQPHPNVRVVVVASGCGINALIKEIRSSCAS